MAWPRERHARAVVQERDKAIERANELGRKVDSWLRYQHFSLDFLDFPCDTNTMNIVLNALTGCAWNGKRRR
jgi:hypothetical protein